MRYRRTLSCIISIIIMVLSFTQSIYATKYGEWLYYGESNNSMTKTWDLNGDGKKDKVKMTLYEKKEEGYYGTYSTIGARIYVNGKKRASIKDIGDQCFYGVFRLKNGARYLYICCAWEDEHTFYVYRCTSSGKLKKEIVIGDEGQGENKFSTAGRNRMAYKKTLGNKVIFNAETQPAGMGYIRHRVVYTYKNGKLQLSGTTYKIIGYNDWNNSTSRGYGISNRIAARDIKIYSDKKCTKSMKVLKKGEQIKITMVYIPSGTIYENYIEKMSYYAKGIGWFNAADYYTNGELFKGSWYAE